MFTAALFTIAKTGKQLKCPSTGEWIKMPYSPEIKPRTYSQLIVDKQGKTIQWKKTVASASAVGKAGRLPVNH